LFAAEREIVGRLLEERDGEPEDMRERRELVRRLVTYELPIEPILRGLAVLPFDSEELVFLRRADIVSILDRFLRDELSADQVTDWAEQVEMRDDIGLEPGFEDPLRDAIFGLANPNLREPVTSELATRLRAEIGNSSA
jgi:hypothetical protein